MRLEELRSTLNEHADGLDDTPQARIAPVRRRVAVARRRRAAAVAGVGVVAVVAAALTVVPRLVDREVAPADRVAPTRLAGRPVPATETSTGLDYRYVRGYQSRAGAGSLDVDVPVGETPRLVMWASSDTTSQPVVRLVDRSADRSATEVSAAGGFDRFAFLPGHADGSTRTERLRLTQTGAGPRTRLALAVYDLGDTSQAGVGDRTMLFRSQVAGESLVKAVVGRPGQTDLRFRVRLPSTDLSYADACSGSTRWFSVTVGGRQLLGGRCQRSHDLLAGDGFVTVDGSPFPAGVGAGDTVEVRIHLSPSARRTSEVASDPHAVLGLALYTHSAPTHRVAGSDLPDLSEDGGHEWRATRWEQAPVGAGSLRIALPPSDRPRLVRFATNGSGTTTRTLLRVSSDGRGRGTIEQEDVNAAGGGAAYGGGYVVQPGGSPTVTLELTEGRTADSRLGLVVSELVH